MINTPHGKFSLNEILNRNFIQKDRLIIKDVPIIYSFPSIIKSELWFGQFGQIKDIIINNQIDSQFKTVIIIYYHNISTMEAINFCKNNLFEDDVKLKAKYGKQKYCKYFLLSQSNIDTEYQCKIKGCPHRHSWNINSKTDNNINKIQAFYNQYCSKHDPNKEKLRGQLTKLAQNITSVAFDKLPEIFQIQFHHSIRTLYIGKIKDLIIYFDDLFQIEYDEYKNKFWMISKIYHKKEKTIEKKYDDDDDDKYLKQEMKYEALLAKYEDLRKEYEYIMKIRDDDPCKIKFNDWLCNIVKLKQYLSVFETYSYDNITMIEFLNKEIIEKELNISSSIHCDLILKRVKEFKIMMKQFDEILMKNDNLYSYKQQLIQHGIITLNELRNDIKTLQNVHDILKVKDRNASISLLQTIQNITTRL